MKIRKEFIVGIVASVGIVGLILGFFYLKGQELWKETDSYYAVFPRSEGLSTGSNVLLNGVQIGVVTEVKLYPGKPDDILVSFDMTELDLKIPMNSTATLSSDLLSGAYINMSFYDTTSYHKNGDTLRCEIQEDLNTLVDKRLGTLETKVKELLGTADTAINVISTLFSRNTDNMDESFEGIRRAILNFEKVSVNLDSMIASFSGSRHKIMAMLDNMASITNNLKESNSEITKTIQNVSSITSSIDSLDLSGTIGKAQTALDQVSIILDEVQNGDGTLTMLMQDSALYDNMNLMVEEAQRLVENIQEHPNRYLQFAVFGSKDKGLNMSSKDEKILKKWVKDTLRDRMDK